MKTVTKYIANDGSQWNDEAKALERDSLIVELSQIMQAIKPRPDDLNFEGYIQQDEASLRRVREALFTISSRPTVLKEWIDRQINEYGKTIDELIYKVHPSWFGRMLDGSCGPLESAYHRLCCIDESFREWNQPYYVLNPQSRTYVCLG